MRIWKKVSEWFASQNNSDILIIIIIIKLSKHVIKKRFRELIKTTFKKKSVTHSVYELFCFTTEFTRKWIRTATWQNSFFYFSLLLTVKSVRKFFVKPVISSIPTYLLLILWIIEECTYYTKSKMLKFKNTSYYTFTEWICLMIRKKILFYCINDQR